MKQSIQVAVIAFCAIAAGVSWALAEGPKIKGRPGDDRTDRNPIRKKAPPKKDFEETDIVYIEDEEPDGEAQSPVRPAQYTDEAIGPDYSVVGGDVCDSCGAGDCTGCCGPACIPRWGHRSGLFGEFLYLRARDAEVTYAAGVDGPTTPPGNPADPGNQVGPLAIVDPDYEPAYRVGFTRALSECSSLRAAFTKFESATSDILNTGPNPFVQSQVTHPGVTNAADNWQQAQARLDVDYELVDVDYRWLYSYSDCHAVNLVAGARYGRLEQDFQADFAFNGTRSVDTNVLFEGGGIRLGLEAERFAPCTGWSLYGRGNASFLAGDLSADFFQGSSFATTEIDTSWEAGRVVTILDVELGVGWTSCGGRVQMQAGYLFSAWLNSLPTDEWIDAVNANHFTELGGSALTFDGWTFRVEYRF